MEVAVTGKVIVCLSSSGGIRVGADLVKIAVLILVVYDALLGLERIVLFSGLLSFILIFEEYLPDIHHSVVHDIGKVVPGIGEMIKKPHG